MAEANNPPVAAEKRKRINAIRQLGWTLERGGGATTAVGLLLCGAAPEAAKHIGWTEIGILEETLPLCDKPEQALQLLGAYLPTKLIDRWKPYIGF